MQATLENLAAALHEECAELGEHNAEYEHTTDRGRIAMWQALADAARTRQTGTGLDSGLALEEAACRATPIGLYTDDALRVSLNREPLGRRAQRSGDVVILQHRHSAQNFRRGVPVTASPYADGSDMRTGSATVVGFSLQDGTVTLDTPDAIVAFADGDFLFRAAENEADKLAGRVSMLEVQNEEMRRWSTDVARMLSELRAPQAPRQADSTEASVVTATSVAQQILELAALRARCRDVEGATAAVQAYLALTGKP